jgi:hypothetical protein
VLLLMMLLLALLWGDLQWNMGAVLCQSVSQPATQSVGQLASQPPSQSVS